MTLRSDVSGPNEALELASLLPVLSSHSLVSLSRRLDRGEDGDDVDVTGIAHEVGVVVLRLIRVVRRRDGPRRCLWVAPAPVAAPRARPPTAVPCSTKPSPRRGTPWPATSRVGGGGVAVYTARATAGRVYQGDALSDTRRHCGVVRARILASVLHAASMRGRSVYPAPRSPTEVRLLQQSSIASVVKTVNAAQVSAIATTAKRLSSRDPSYHARTASHPRRGRCSRTHSLRRRSRQPETTSCRDNGTPQQTLPTGVRDRRSCKAAIEVAATLAPVAARIAADRAFRRARRAGW